MLLKITFGLLCLVLFAAASPVDDNAMADLVLQNYFSAMNVSGRSIGCLPKIVHGPKGSVIQPFSGWRGNVALIVDYGTCAPGDQGFICAVHWGDGSPPEVKRLKDFGPCQIAHQYPKENNHYLVMAFYCSSPVRCDCYVRSIDTSYDPGNIGISV